jgi:hypothetical protein
LQFFCVKLAFKICNALNKKISCNKKVIENDNNYNVPPITTKITSITTKIDVPECNITCKYCFKKFSRKDVLNKHIANVCKIKKQHENNKEKILQQLIDKDKQKDDIIKSALEEIKHLRGEINELKKHNSKSKNTSIKNNNNTTNSNNTTNNIIMMDFGKENLQIIDRSEFVKIVKNNKITGVKITDELLKAIHFNDKYPQLNNIYISDINRQKCMIVENNEWKLSPVDQIPQVIDNIIKYSNDKNKELSEKYKDNKTVIDRLKIIDKYTKLSDPEHLEELIEEEAPKRDIKRCKEFQQHAYDTVKTTLYNKGKKNKIIK